MEKTFSEYMQEYKTESREKFFDLFRSYGATEEMIEVVEAKLVEMPEDYYQSNIEHKLALLDAVGVPIDKICEHPQFLKTPMKKFLLKCEIAILEDCFVDIKLLQTTHHKELVANFGARERGYLPENRNIFYGLNDSRKIAGLSRPKYMDRFYSMKTFIRLHDKFRDEYPGFYEIFSSFPEFKAICVHSKDKTLKREESTQIKDKEPQIEKREKSKLIRMNKFF